MRENTVQYFRHNRQSLQLGGFDYRTSAAYFVTVCTQKRRRTLGRIVNQVLIPSIAGVINYREWFRSAAIRSES